MIHHPAPARLKATLILLALLAALLPATVASGESTFRRLETEGAALIKDSLRNRMTTRDGIEPVTVDMLRQLALERNLDIRLSGYGEQRAELEEIRRDAVFDTELQLTLTYTRKDSYYRSSEITRTRRNTADDDEDEQDYADGTDSEDGYNDDAVTDDDPTCVYIDGVLMNPAQCKSHFVTSRLRETASYNAHDKRLPELVVGNVGLNRNFPWGQSLEVGFSSRWQTNKFPSLGEYDYLFTWDDGVDGYPYGNNPWTSSLSIEVSTPLPFCRNFGDSGNYNAVLRRVSALDTQQTRLARQARATDILAQAYQSWWDLSGALARLAVVTEARSHLEALRAKTARQTEEGDSTAYDLAQVGATLQEWRGAEESVWSEYQFVSNQLSELLDMEPGLLFFPSGFAKVIGELPSGLPPKPDQDAAKAQEQAALRPELKAAGIDLQSKTAMQIYHRTNLRPDIALTFTSSLSQDPTYWGYSSWDESARNIVNPDVSSFYIGFVYTLPIGDRDAKAAYSNARIQKEKSRLNYATLENDIAREIRQARTDTQANAQDMAYARQSMLLKRKAYEKARELSEEDASISSFQLLQRFTESVTAELLYITAAVDWQKAGVETLRATGRLLPEGWVLSPEAPEEEQP